MSIPSIVLLHGQPDSSASFWRLRRELVQRLPSGVRVLAPDRPGYGANPLPATDYAGNVRWLDGWLKRVDAGPVVLVGHSWAGGIAALTAVGANPPAGVVLLASVGPGCLVPIDPVLGAPLLGAAISYATLRIGRPLLQRRASSVIRSALAPEDWPYSASSGLAMRHRPLWRSFLIEQRALLRELPDIDAALPQIRTPVQVLFGSADPVIPARTPRAIAASIPHAQLHQLDGGGHDLQLSRPVAVAEQLVSFAETVLSGSVDSTPAAR